MNKLISTRHSVRDLDTNDISVINSSTKFPIQSPQNRSSTPLPPQRVQSHHNLLNHGPATHNGNGASQNINVLFDDLRKCTTDVNEGFADVTTPTETITALVRQLDIKTNEVLGASVNLNLSARNQGILSAASAVQSEFENQLAAWTNYQNLLRNSGISTAKADSKISSQKLPSSLKSTSSNNIATVRQTYVTVDEEMYVSPNLDESVMTTNALRSYHLKKLRVECDAKSNAMDHAARTLQPVANFLAPQRPSVVRACAPPPPPPPLPQNFFKAPKVAINRPKESNALKNYQNVPDALIISSHDLVRSRLRCSYLPRSPCGTPFRNVPVSSAIDDALKQALEKRRKDLDESSGANDSSGKWD
uniref:WH2 domain-containing protein n=1 Tax=Panagrolaimus superbus TaxID=310955 RepID=A0A914YZR3_9BILA